MAVNFLKHLSGRISGVVIDITGVLYESGTSKAINGSVDAVNRLRDLKIPFRFLTNETQRTKSSLAKKLQSFGFKLEDKEIIAPAPLAMKMVQEKKLRPFLLVHPGVLPEFEQCDQSSPNCVVMGDAGNDFSYKNVNQAFQLLVAMEKPLLISMGRGKFYKDDGKLVLDVGAYTAALEYACGLEAVVVGKPSPDYFRYAAEDMGINIKEAVMVGDDINSDVGGSQKCGMQGVLVRTGKYRPKDETHDSIKPNAIVDNFSQFVDLLNEYLSRDYSS